ncbi:wac [Drosophila busckii]|uniref:Wac n=2 Tax=Drosophila busckii TaxID=30019 RepID=A0A0M5J3B3_DROBS|nr:wac [Drosophila busckii]
MQDINLDCLREFYFIKKREWIDNKVIIASQTAELKKVTSVIEETNKEIAKLEIFLANVNKRLIADGALQRKIIEIEDKTKALLDRQKTVSEPKECNTEAIIEKIEELQSANQSR